MGKRVVVLTDEEIDLILGWYEDRIEALEASTAEEVVVAKLEGSRLKA